MRHRSTGVIDIIDVIDAGAQHRMENGKCGLAMSTIDEVRAADKKVREILDALKSANVENEDQLGIELRQATDEYAKAIRELPM